MYGFSLYLKCSEIVFHELNTELETRTRYFFQEPVYAGQKTNSYSTNLKSEAYLEWDNNLSLTVTPYFRYDKFDHNRSDLDLRESFLLLFKQKL